ncbi:hypothetical protein WJX72_000650 [[Myrmecia] bisecta]|uniref:Uncharacterized protein n=1 Tax=[Myrmecia] bisecta TaxID=41462 RepID=A0AAW1R4G3_9CHLO
MQHALNTAPPLFTAPAHFSAQLAYVQVQTSGVIAFPIEEVWSVVRNFGRLSLWTPAVETQLVESQLLPGDSEGFVGAVRVVQIGDKKLCERVTAIDDELHVMKWKLISHPLNCNPFPASFVNYKATLTLRPVTVGNQTLMEWDGEFYTEHAYADSMRHTWRTMYEAGFVGLHEYLSSRSPHSSLMLSARSHIILESLRNQNSSGGGSTSTCSN